VAKSFKLEYTNKGWQAGIGEKIIDIRSDDKGIRDIAKELGISKQKVQETLKELKHKIDCLCKGCHD
jgi:transposase-like protein